MARLLPWNALAALSVWCVTASAAEHASVTLAYTRDEAAKSCPDEATFRGLVAARLGYDPFVAAGALALSVDFRRRGNEVVGRLSLSGKQRTLRAGADDCFELATSMALIAAVAVDPDAVRTRAETPGPAEKPAENEPEPVPLPVPEVPQQPAPRPPSPAVVDENGGVRLELGALLPVGIVPAPRGGVRAGAAVHVGRFSIGAEGDFLFPSARAKSSGEVSAYVLNGSIVPCAHPADSERWLLSLCAVGSLGALRSSAARVTRAEASTDLFATVGPRAAAVLMLSRATGVGASADVPVTLSRVHLHIEDDGQPREVWAQSRVGFIGGLSLVARLK